MAIVRTLMAVIHVAVILAGREKIVIKVNWLLFKFSQLFILRYALVYRERCHSRLDPTDMRESTSVFQIRTINRSKLDKSQVSVIDSRRK